ncbi:MAG: MBL fold metallo-hydrolase [Kiritimatiellaeota bacterium]|nr:MBL fold metallo-hydrolase [Kiritimatiellota bacterium]
MIPDQCNVYVLKAGKSGLAIDFGSGAWMQRLPALGIERIEQVLLTHHHADQCAGLAGTTEREFIVRAPAGEKPNIDPADLARRVQEWKKLTYSPYFHNAALWQGVPGIICDLHPDSELWFGPFCLRIVHTPGHGMHACSYVVEAGDLQLCFCGDAAHAGATIWEPYHLEWDHWTGEGALAAWQGIKRLLGIGIDRLLPSHGPLIESAPNKTLWALADKLLNFYTAKGCIAPGEKDHFVAPAQTFGGTRRYLDSLYQFGTNGYLLVSKTNEGLVVDPALADLPFLDSLLKRLGNVRPTAILITHCHADHCSGVANLQATYQARAYLHPKVAEKIGQPPSGPTPYLPAKPVQADVLLPENGTWTWNEYAFRVAHWPGQTWWHAAYLTTVDRQKVLFGGDSFQPVSRWNGTGGFCANNNSRFREGFIPSARLMLTWQPDILANGHRCVFRFTESRFRQIIDWAYFAERAVLALCPSGDLETDYYKPYHPYERKRTAPKPEKAKLPERQAESTIRKVPAPANKAASVPAPKAKDKHRPKKIIKATKAVGRVKPKAKPVVRHTPAVRSKASHKKLKKKV